MPNEQISDNPEDKLFKILKPNYPTEGSDLSLGKIFIEGIEYISIENVTINCYYILIPKINESSQLLAELILKALKIYFKQFELNGP